MAEDTHFSGCISRVTEEQVILGDKSYKIREIKSANLERVRTDSGLWWAASLLMVALLAFATGPFGANGYDLTRLERDILLAIMAIGLVAAIFLINFKKPEFLYFIKLKGTFGAAKICPSWDKGHVQGNLETINMALARQSQNSTTTRATQTE